MMGTPARLAARRPKIPALPLWVWTMCGFCRTNQFGNNRQQAGNLFHFRFERPFGAYGRAGDQFRFDAGFLAQAENSSDGVLLRAADDKSRDDVGDTHRAVRMIYFLSSRNRCMMLVASAVLVFALAK